MFWNALTFCPANHHVFPLKSHLEGYSYMYLIFKRERGEKKTTWISTLLIAGDLFCRQLGQTVIFFLFLS